MLVKKNMVRVQHPAKPLEQFQPAKIDLSDKHQPPSWGVLGHTARGASHVRKDQPNQDAMAWFAKPGPGWQLVVAVADGHGSPQCFRSGIGAQLAVLESIRILNQFADAQIPSPSLPTAQWVVKECLPLLLTKRWQDAVKRHLKLNTFSASESAKLHASQTQEKAKGHKTSPYQVYGTTLLSILVTDYFILFLQIGDGDIITVSDAGKPSRALPEDQSLLGNYTTSLCLPNPAANFRGKVLSTREEPPALIILSTDGYGNSFQDEKAFLQAGPDFLRMIKRDGPSEVQASLHKWLVDTSSEGSGDDISVAVVFRIDQSE